MLSRKPKPPQRDRSAEFAGFVPTARPIAKATTATASERVLVRPKDTPRYCEAWRRAVAELPCVQCGSVGATQASHRNEGKGMGMKTDDALTAALCVKCHSEIDQGGALTREERRQRMDRAILRTLVLLFRDGKVRVA